MTKEKRDALFSAAIQQYQAAIGALIRAQQHDYPGHYGALTLSARSHARQAEQLIDISESRNLR